MEQLRGHQPRPTQPRGQGTAGAGATRRGHILTQDVFTTRTTNHGDNAAESPSPGVAEGDELVSLALSPGSRHGTKPPNTGVLSCKPAPLPEVLPQTRSPVVVKH